MIIGTGKKIRLYLSWIRIHIFRVGTWKKKKTNHFIWSRDFSQGEKKKCTKSICHCFTSQPLRMKSQTAKINGNFAIDFDRPKMSSSVFYYTQKPDVRISTAFWSTVQHNSIHQSEANHIITQSLFPLASMGRVILLFPLVLEKKKVFAVFVSNSFTHC